MTTETIRMTDEQIEKMTPAETEAALRANLERTTMSVFYTTRPPADEDRYPVLQGIDLMRPPEEVMYDLPSGWDWDDDGRLAAPPAAERHQVTWDCGTTVGFAQRATDAEITEGFEVTADGGSIEVEARGVDAWTGEEDGYSVTLHPVEPVCAEGDEHNWGGDVVSGHGGGVIVTETCSRCGMRKHTDTWADDGRGGVMTGDHVSYTEPEDDDPDDGDCDGD